MIRHANTRHATATVQRVLRNVRITATVRTDAQGDGSLLSRAIVKITSDATVELALQALRAAGFADVAPAAISSKKATVYARSWLPEGKR